MEKHMCSGDQGESEMTNQQGEQDLLNALLHSDGLHYTWAIDQPLAEDSIQVDEQPTARISYPWNPGDPESEVFFTESEQASFLDGWQEAEIATRADSFFGQLNQQWATSGLQSYLAQRFALRMPQELLTSIAAQAQQLVASSRQTVANSLSLADQLVQCIQEVAINLGQDDLYVQARLLEPMRNGGSNTAVETLLQQIPQTEWQHLSDIQKARLSLAIAHCAIDELQSQELH